jgi:type III restriction enzyme
VKLELKEFQEDAVAELVKRVRQAKREVREGDPQAVILASPTGSGKTVITTKLMEDILNGNDEIPSEPDAVFLWLSDQPELNIQSRKKIVSTSTRFREHELIIIDTDFDREIFEGGRVYFLNTQKLGKDKNLVTKGDKRQYTIWETIKNTEKALGDHFYLIIDEAHRGMNRSAREENQSLTIIQKFVLGEVGVIEPIKLIIGVSATPDRFNKLLEETEAVYGRTARPVNINPEDVRNSGLLKDKIILFHPETEQPTDWTLLAAAAQRWKKMCDAWNIYTVEQGIPQVNPVMVIQVEDGNDHILTRTDLALAIQTLEKEIGPIQDEELAHAFQEDGEIIIGNRKIQKIDASSIQEETTVKFVFFKMALTTGWDCPRAEVMMSFRKAQDHTLIAQLIGRMIRTPLARRVEGQELLNSVSLYLPHYNQEGVRQVVERLKSDPNTVPPTDIEDGNSQITLNRREDSQDAYEALKGIPTYRVERIRKQSNTRRLMKLSRLLTSIHAIDLNALDESKHFIVETLNNEVQRLKREEPEFVKKVTGGNEITVNAVTIEQGTWKDLGGQPEKIPLNERNIDDLFHRAGQRLGEGLEIEYLKVNYNPDNSNQIKLELFLTLQNQNSWDLLERKCGERINELFNKHKINIAQLKSSEQEQYNKVRELAKEPESFEFAPPMEIIISIEKERFVAYDKHLYQDSNRNYYANFNSWEQAVIQAEIENLNVVGWLRNYERKPWSLAVPYDDGAKVLPMFPDFIIIRRDGDKLIIDILEPHRQDLDDSWKKARGLARYAQKHYMGLGRIELIRKKGDQLQRLNFIDPVIYKKVLEWVTSNEHLDQLFEENLK